MRGVLVLNRNMDYWDEVSVRRAINKILNGRAEVVAHNGKLLGTTPEGMKLWLPLIIQLKNFVSFKCKSDIVHFSSNAVYDRDNNYCQYWHDYTLVDGQLVSSKTYMYRCTEDDRTIDHVVPLSKKGSNTFTNVVCACKYCNEILKKDSLLSECGLKLIKLPIVPKKTIGEYVQRKFVFNPSKPSHQEYVKLRYGGKWK